MVKTFPFLPTNLEARMKRKSVNQGRPAKKRASTPTEAKRRDDVPAREEPVPVVTKGADASERKSGQGSISAEERLRMIRRLAYLQAEKRGFQGGSPLEDWLQAEAEVDAQIARTAAKNS
jgi:hypothetical protein